VGTGAGLGNQGGLTLSEDGRWLISVNAGSDDLTVFSVERGGLKKVQTIRSGGIRPVSVTVDDDLVYVLNAGSDNLSGFRMNYKGQLQPVAGSTRPLSGTGTNPAQIAFSPDGNNLVVTEKTTNKLVVYSVDRSGLPEQLPQIVPSPGQTPFGFSFANRRQLLVSEAAGGAPNGSSVSSYRLGRDSMLAVVAGAVPTHQTAACWIEVTPSGRYAYATNTGSSSVSGYRVRYTGDISLLNDDGVTASTGEASRPIDLGITRDGRFLYTLNSGNQTLGMFKIKSDGSLESLGSIGGIPEGANGLVAR
jgi:6-phosphogluconolactonase (cycloisomerase 2 family)